MKNSIRNTLPKFTISNTHDNSYILNLNFWNSSFNNTEAISEIAKPLDINTTEATISISPVYKENYLPVIVNISSEKRLSWIRNTDFSQENNHVSKENYNLKQIKFLTQTLMYLIKKYSEYPSQHKINFDTSILNVFFSFLEEKNPVVAFKKFIEFITMGWKEKFSLSFFVFNNFTVKVESLERYKEILSEVKILFNLLAKKEIVLLIKGRDDTLILPFLRKITTKRNVGIFNNSSFLIPLNKISIFDAVIIYSISSKFTLKGNLAIGKISKNKLNTMNLALKGFNFNSFLKRICVSVSDILI